jgi:DUF4097 and DUF4098 domain-containing protein YvlB
MESRITSSFVALLVLLLSAMAATPSQAAVEGSFQRTLTVNGAVDLDINTGSGSITVRTGSSDSVAVTGHIRATEWFDRSAREKVQRLESNPPIQQSGNSIHIGHIEDPELKRNISISYEVVVPADTRLKSETGSGSQTIDGIRGDSDVHSGSGSLKIANTGSTVRADTGSGSITVDHVGGNVRARTGSGSIHATEIAGGFEGNTGSGSIHLEQAAPGAVRVETGSGDMELRGVRGSLEARAGSGSIRADGDPRGGWLVHTGSGRVRPEIPTDAAFELDARTSSGSISLQHPVTIQGRISRKEVHGRVRGGGVQVEVHTGSGDIEIL